MSKMFSLKITALFLMFFASSNGNVSAASSSALSEDPIPMLTQEEIANKKRAYVSKSKFDLLKPKNNSHSSKLSNRPAPLLTEDEIPKRAALPVEKGEEFLKSGNLRPGITLPTGAIWRPALWVFGDFRTTIGHYNNGTGTNRQYFSNRLDIFINLKLTPTERILLSFSPLSRHRRDHTGWVHDQNRGGRFVNGLNANIETLFFEGDFGEIFPSLDPDDKKQLDFGFSIGRQPIFFQEGMMINDTIDALAITRDTIMIKGITPDMRLTALFGFNDIDRDDNARDNSAYLVGLFSETDLRRSTVNLDAAYVFSNSNRGGDGFFIGASATQRIGHWNTSFRANASVALENRGSAVDDGVLLFSEFSKTETGSENIIYANAFLALGNYTSAARDRGVGGPLGPTGILFAAPPASLGGPALSNRASNAFGGAIGYQKFFNHEKSQIVFELGGRKDIDGSDEGAAAIGAQFLHALTNRTSLQIDAFVSAGENRDIGTGLRTELRVRF